MGKRSWRNEVPEVEQLAQMAGGSEQALALWAVVERLEALVAIGDVLEEVADLWANTLAFGGQPVGEVGSPASELGGPVEVLKKVAAWQCDKKKDCVLMKGHGGDCASPPPKHCQCVKPDIAADGVCNNCGV